MAAWHVWAFERRGNPYIYIVKNMSAFFDIVMIETRQRELRAPRRSRLVICAVTTFAAKATSLMAEDS